MAWVTFLALLAVFCSQPASATVVADTLLDPEGNPASGIIVILNAPFQTSGGQFIVARQRTVELDVSGSFSITLEPTTTAIPAGTRYLVRYTMADRQRWTEFWSVPETGPVTVSEITTMTPPSPSLFVQLQNILGGGAITGDCLKWSGSQWAPDSCTAGSGVIPCIEPLTELTIDAAGALDISSSGCFSVDTFADASSDNLETITCTAGIFFILRQENASRAVIVEASASIPILDDFHLDDRYDALYMRCPSIDAPEAISRDAGGF